jgi:hypothetical protein
MLVVIAIAASFLLSSSGDYELDVSNKRTACNTNLSQIYNAMRQNANDYDGNYPYANALYSMAVSLLTRQLHLQRFVDTMGLWKLYTTNVDPNEIRSGAALPMQAPFHLQLIGTPQWRHR